MVLGLTEILIVFEVKTIELLNGNGQHACGKPGTIDLHWKEI